MIEEYANFDIQINIIINLFSVLSDGKEERWRLADGLDIDYLIFDEMLKGELRENKYFYLWEKIIKCFGEGIVLPHFGINGLKECKE